MIPALRLRIAVALVSLATIGLELALMRALSFRFWHHFAYMVISLALLGFGASGTMLTLLRTRVLRRPNRWLWSFALVFALSILLVPRAAQHVPLNVHSLAWDLWQFVNVLVLALVLFVPFFLAGAVVGIALMDKPGRIGGHYAANLVGSGLGAVLAILAMHVLATGQLVAALAVVAYIAAALLLEWRKPRAALAGATVGIVIILLSCLAPWEPAASQYKRLSQARNTPGTRTIYRTEGPLGRLDVIAGPHIHDAPGLSLQYALEHPDGVPPQVVLLADGDRAGLVFRCPRREDWVFMDYTTPAAVYHLYSRPRVLVVGAGGGTGIGLARYHNSAEIVALEANPQIIGAMTGPLRDRGGDIYLRENVTVVNRGARGYLAGTGRKFDIIQVPAVGASSAGLYDTQESYLYTVESFEQMLDHLAGDGALCITRPAATPPRDELRALDMAAVALRRRRLDPTRHIAMIRNWATVSVIVFATPVTAERAAALRGFCQRRGFDLCALPGLQRSEANREHQLPEPYYYDAARALLGPERDAFVRDYMFDLRPATDDRPYFFHTFRWRALRALRTQVAGMSPAYLQLGYLLSVAALAQGVLVAAVLILLPLAGRARSLARARRRTAIFGYFLMLGLGFMLLEMGFLQKLILYLAHPIYSAAAVIAGFLVFGGLGSQVSHLWAAPPKRVVTAAAVAVLGISLLYAFGMDGWLALTQPQAIWLRFLVACATIAPLAFAMGHMFPVGLRLVGVSQPAVVPWAWAVNGFASVVATVGTPLLAAEVGFSRVIFAAVFCYAFAGIIVRWLPDP